MNLKALLEGEVFELEVRRRENGDGVFGVRVGEQRHEVRFSEPEPGVFSLLVENFTYEVVVRPVGDELDVTLAGRSYRMRLQDPADVARGGALGSDGSQVVRSVMAGKVVAVMVSEGDQVRAGAPLLVIEAMKMENEIRAPRDGVVRVVSVAAGEPVETGAELVTVE